MVHRRICCGKCRFGATAESRRLVSCVWIVSNVKQSCTLEMNARDVMLKRLRRRNPETALEREFYCSPEDYQVDLDMIWYRDWLFVGHDCEVPNPGNYMTVQIGEYPVFMVRDRDGCCTHSTIPAGIAVREFVPRQHGTHRGSSAPITSGPTRLMAGCYRARDMGKRVRSYRSMA